MVLELLLIPTLFFVNTQADHRIGYFWHVTDFHHDQTYWTKGLSCNEVVPIKGKYGDFWCDSPWSLVMETIKEMYKVKPDVDFLIWTGDTVAHIKDDKTNLTINLDVIKNITDALTDQFPVTPVYASLGNHDFYPSDQASAETSRLYRDIGNMWKHWINDEDASQDFAHGGYYAKDITPDIRLIALNTNLYYQKDHVTKTMHDPAGQLEWLGQQLKQAKEADQKVFLTGHVPVGPLSPGLWQWFHPQYIQPFLDLILEYDDVITASHFGHNHGDGFQILQNHEQKSIAQFIAPSVTPWRYKLSWKTGPPHNPGVRLVKYDRTTGQNLDYDQYFMKLYDSNLQKNAIWKKLYTFTKAYGVPDMSVQSLRTIFEDKMESPDSKEAQKFCNFNLVRPFDMPCTLEMRADIRCAGLFTIFEEAKTCAKNYVNANKEN